MNPYISYFAFAFLATISFAILFQTPKKDVWKCGIVGAVGWCVYKYMAGAGYQSFGANFAASFALTVVGGFFAGLGRKPHSMFVATGVIPLVPGLKLYDGMCGLVLGNYDEGTKILLSAGTDAIAIAVGVMLGASIFDILDRLQLKKKLMQRDSTDWDWPGEKL